MTAPNLRATPGPRATSRTFCIAAPPGMTKSMSWPLVRAVALISVFVKDVFPGIAVFPGALTLVALRVRPVSAWPGNSSGHFVAAASPRLRGRLALADPANCA
jgi:hypothetical protein